MVFFSCWPQAVVLPAAWKKERKKQTKQTNYSHGKSRGTTFHLWGLLEITNAKHLPYPTNNVERVHPDFSRVSTLYRVGRGEKRELQDTFKKVSLFHDGTQNYRKLRILHHFPQDFCRRLYFTAIQRESCWIYLFLWKIWYTKTCSHIRIIFFDFYLQDRVKIFY